MIKPETIISFFLLAMGQIFSNNAVFIEESILCFIEGDSMFLLILKVFGIKVKRFMSKQIQYSEEPVGKIKLVSDFLPSPAGSSLY